MRPRFAGTEAVDHPSPRYRRDWGAEFAEFPETGWDKVMDLNVKSAFFMTQKLSPLLKAAGRADDYARETHLSPRELACLESAAAGKTT